MLSDDSLIICRKRLKHIKSVRYRPASDGGMMPFFLRAFGSMPLSSELTADHKTLSAFATLHFLAASNRRLSSSSLQGPLFSFGSRMLHHLSRHCASERPGTCAAMSRQHVSPTRSTARTSASSSCVAHFPFTRCRSFSGFSGDADALSAPSPAADGSSSDGGRAGMSIRV